MQGRQLHSKAYSPILNKWISYHSFTPNYYVEQKLFSDRDKPQQTPLNRLWSHLLTNQSYQVFMKKTFCGLYYKECFLIKEN
jgi:hypothetical protein